MKTILLILLSLLFSSNAQGKTGAWSGGPEGCPTAGTFQNVVFYPPTTGAIPQDATITNVVVNVFVSEPFPNFWISSTGAPATKVVFPSSDFVDYFRGLNTLDTIFYMRTINEWNGNCLIYIIVNWEAPDPEPEPEFNPAMVPITQYLLN